VRLENRSEFRVAVHADGADEHIPPDAFAQQFGNRSHLPGRVAADVDARIPGSTRKCLQACGTIVTIASESLDRRRQFVGRFPAIEESHPVSGGKEGFGKMPADELSAPQNQNAHDP
jgi:hypothetical protein